MFDRALAGLAGAAALAARGTANPLTGGEPNRAD
jgi:hypothetical protein